jgi:hypothetical protein
MERNNDGRLVLTSFERGRLDQQSADFVISEAEKTFRKKYDISEKITERGYSWLKIIISVYPIATGLLVQTNIINPAPIVILFAISMAIIGLPLYLTLRPYDAQAEADSPENVLYDNDLSSDNVYFAFLLSKIEAMQYKIEQLTASNSKRAKYINYVMCAAFGSSFAFIAMIVLFILIG